MLPVLFSVGPVQVLTHDFFVFLGVMGAGVTFFLEARRRDMTSEKLLWVVTGALAGAVIFARLGVVLHQLVEEEEVISGGLVLSGGRTALGGLAGAYVGAVLTKRIVRYRVPTGDLFAPAVAIGMAIGRWGCFLTEQIGTPTSMPWGIRVSAEIGSRIPNCPGCLAGLQMHPSFVYEILFHAVAFGLLLRLRHRIFQGELLKVYLLGYAVFRFAVEYVRGNEVVWAGLTGPQVFLIPSTIVLAVYFLRHLERGASHRSAITETTR